jgi:hypothetical protein
MKRWAGGGIIRSSVVTKYQLGFDFQAGSLTDPLRAPRHLGIRHKCCPLWVYVAGELSGELGLVQEQKTVLRR